MAVSKYKHSLKKKLNLELSMIVSGLRKENGCLKKTVAEFSRFHAEHNKLMERFLSLESARFESCQQLAAKDKKMASSSEELCTTERNLTDDESMKKERSTPSYTEEIEEIKHKIATISTKCQYLESKIAGNQDSASDEQASPSDGGLSDLQDQLNDALEKNKKWLEYDQEREAYVRFITARLFWLQDQLNETYQTPSQHEDDSDDNRLHQMQEYYVKLLHNAKDEQDVLREQLKMTNQKLIISHNRYKEKDREVEKLKQQLHTEIISKQSGQEEDYHCSEGEEPPVRDETKELQVSLQEERRRSASFELQAKLFQGYMLNHYHADQEKIEDMKRQRDQQDQCLAEEEQPASNSALNSSSHSSILNESILECPSCQAEYPASQYQDLLSHLEMCFE